MAAPLFPLLEGWGPHKDCDPLLTPLLHAALDFCGTACCSSNGICAFMSDAPPSTSINCPVIHSASAEQSRLTAFPISAGVPSLLIGVHPLWFQSRMASCTASGRLFRTLSSTHPGLRLFTVISRCASATAK